MDEREQIKNVFAETTDEVRRVVSEVLGIEAKFLHMALPRGIHEEIVDMVERIVK